MKHKCKLSALLLIISLLAVFFSCQLVDPEITDSMLDGNFVIDTALIDSGYFLISDSIKRETAVNQAAMKLMPVIVCAHGFTATTYEWQEFRNYADSMNIVPGTPPDSQFLVSQVLLGGHGRSYDDFKASTWENWRAPIFDEYKKLADAGFTNISLAGSSTGGALILNLLAKGAFKGLPAPKNIFMIDAIVIPGAKILTLINIAGPILGNDISKGTELEQAHWYTNRPAEALSQLMEVIVEVRKQLENTITLAPGSRMKVWKAKQDGSADPVSALLMWKGMRNSDGSRVEVEMVDTKKHVFTRLLGRDNPTPADIALQMKTFAEMRQRLLTP